MKYVVFLMSALLVHTPAALAQDEVGTVTEPTSDTQPTTSDSEVTAAPADEKDERGPYYKKVQGWLWLEGFAGPSSYNPDKFGSLDFGVSTGNAPRLKGPEYGFAIGTAFGGPFFLGWFYRQANYGEYKLMKTGLDMQGNFRFVPYVHPILRASIGFAKTFDGNPYGSALTDVSSGGVSFTGGVGVRIPIVRWISFATTFDWTFVALSLRAAQGSSWISGQQFGATFALTFHFIGVRRN